MSWPTHTGARRLLPSTQTQWLATVGIFAFIVPWVALALSKPEEVTATIVAIPSEGEDLSAPVTPAFASAPYFLIVDLQDSGVRAVENPYADYPDSLGMKAALLLLKNRAGTVLAKQVTPQARNLLFHRGASVYRTVGVSGRDALAELRTGTATLLRPFTSNPDTGMHATSPTADATTGDGSGSATTSAASVAAQAPVVTARSSGALASISPSAPAPARPPAPGTASGYPYAGSNTMASSVAAARGVPAPPMPFDQPTAAQPPAGPTPLGASPPVRSAGATINSPAVAPSTVGANDVLSLFGLRVMTIEGVGAQVTSVASGSKAQWAGFRPGDIIVRLGATVIRNADQLRQLVSQTPVDRDLLIRVLRNNGAVERLLVLGGEPERRNAVTR